MPIARVILAAALLASLPARADTAADAIEAAVAAPSRTEANRARDAYRHPVETLEFFGVRPDMRVVEIWPGSAGYYTEILAPLLHDQGKLTIAIFGDEPDRVREMLMQANDDIRRKLASNPAVYGRVEVSRLWAPTEVKITEEGQADAVLTFRNLHNWIAWGQTEATLAAFYRALKPGGILGVVDHRAPADQPVDPEAKSGYVNQDRAIELIEAAGFELVATSEVNANPKDTGDHPRGVWTLPPTFALGAQDREKYASVGESDRFTLLFRKP